MDPPEQCFVAKLGSASFGLDGFGFWAGAWYVVGVEGLSKQVWLGCAGEQCVCMVLRGPEQRKKDIYY